MDNFINGKKYTQLFNHVKTMDVRRKRDMFKYIRTTEENNLFFPHVGCMFEEVCVHYIMKKANSGKQN